MIKKTFYACIIFLGLTNLHAQEIFKTLQTGDTLIYSIKRDETETILKATIKEFGKQIVTHYAYSTGNVSGSITISEQALKNASIYNFDFSGGNQVFTDQSALFLSKKSMQELKRKRKTVMTLSNFDAGPWEGGVDGYGIIYKGESVEARVYYLGLNYYQTNPMKEIIVLDNETCPIFIHINASWSMDLVEIR